MATPITAADLSNFEPKFIAPARFTLQNKTLAKGLFRNEPLPDHQGRTLNVPKYGEFEAHDATEGVEVDNPQSLAQSNVTVTPSEIVAQFLLTDVAVRTGGENHVRNGGKVLGQAMAKKLDIKGLSRFSNFSTHALGGAATDITVGHLTAAAARLEGNAEPTPTPLYAVLRPEQMRVILNAIAPTGTYPIADGLSEEIVNQYLKHDFKLFGLNGGFISGNISRTADANQTGVGAVFSKEAVLYVPADDMNIEKERRVRARAWLYQASHTFGYGEYLESWGVKMTFKAADPTS